MSKVKQQRNRQKPQKTTSKGGQLPFSTTKAFLALSHEILGRAQNEESWWDFFNWASKNILAFMNGEAVDIVVKELGHLIQSRYSRTDEPSFSFTSRPWNEGIGKTSCLKDLNLECACHKILIGDVNPECRAHQSGGKKFSVHHRRENCGGDTHPVAMRPLVVGDECIGLLRLQYGHGDGIEGERKGFFEGIADTLGLALAYRRSQAALRERVKEMTCLYDIARIAKEPSLSLPDILQRIVNVLPRAWLYADIAEACIELDDVRTTTASFQNVCAKLSANISIGDRSRGQVTVAYRQDKPERDEGPFLREERNLINAVAREVALIVAEKEAEENRQRLEEQIMHADRLATLGQLAAGVAHEINEPLGGILGFSQLAYKTEGMPSSAVKDIEKIINSCLHAREVVKKLLIFARQKLPVTDEFNINDLIEDGIYFLESRCMKEGIRLVKKLAPSLPNISADRSQIHQVLVNLVVNAIQAMPGGGILTLETALKDDGVYMSVCDTGVGMSLDVRKKIFIPFFTTKDVGQGTGLGLSVVHGIVTAHGGNIQVESCPGKGSMLEVWLPMKVPVGELEV